MLFCQPALLLWFSQTPSALSLKQQTQNNRVESASSSHQVRGTQSPGWAEAAAAKACGLLAPVLQVLHDFITAGEESSEKHFGERGTNHSEHGGLALRRCRDAICTLAPFILAGEAMWLSDNILPSEMCFSPFRPHEMFRSSSQFAH